VRGTTTSDQLARLASDNERNHKTAGAADPSLRHEINRTIADQWCLISEVAD
jgi:hypothetical protein